MLKSTIRASASTTKTVGDEGVRGIARDRQGSSGKARNAVTERLELRASGKGLRSSGSIDAVVQGKMCGRKWENDELTLLL
jgi:hypothetical protein